MRFFLLLSAFLPLLTSANPVPGILFAPDGSINIVARNAIPEANPDTSLADIEKRQGASTRNDLINGVCKKVTVIFARGTTEPGNLGTVVGPPLVNAVNSALGSANVAFQGVNNYPADVAGFLAGGSASGAANMAALANQAATQCPQTQIVLSGYSQGAQVVSKATAQLGSATINKIKAVVLFGNPNGNDPVPNISSDKVKIFCRAGDNICAGGALVLAPHLQYGQDTPAAASFIRSKVTV